MGIETEERGVDRTELLVADEVFLCGTAAEVAPVTRIDGRLIGSGEPGAVTLRLQRAYEKAVRGKLPPYRGWVEPVYGKPETRRVGAA
jgi:branched-chain amino acid aminotransferase